MNNKLFYPALYHTADEGGFWITFPDFPECFTQGDDMTEAYEMAVDALGLAITSRENEHQEIPQASTIDSISTSSGEFVVIVEFDLLDYKRRTNNRAVKKTLSIPEWLNEADIAAGLNFSQVLQDALKEQLQITR